MIISWHGKWRGASIENGMGSFSVESARTSTLEQCRRRLLFLACAAAPRDAGANMIWRRRRANNKCVPGDYDAIQIWAPAAELIIMIAVRRARSATRVPCSARLLRSTTRTP
jgi:hypothetical protein